MEEAMSAMSCLLGTHRHLCPATRLELRPAAPPRDVAEFVAVLTPVARMLATTRALVASPANCLPPPAPTCSLLWIKYPDAGTILAGAKVYTDGS